MDCPALISNLYTPKIIWYQTDVTVVLRIILPDVKKYFLHVEIDHLRFSAIVNNKSYYICLYLFGGVIAEKSYDKNIGREIKIYLYKTLKWFDWLRLESQKQKNPFIVHDVDHINECNWNRYSFNYNGMKSLEEYKREHGITNIMPDVPSSDEEESEDEYMDSLFF